MVYIRKDGTANRTNETLCFAFERMPTLVTSHTTMANTVETIEGIVWNTMKNSWRTGPSKWWTSHWCESEKTLHYTSDMIMLLWFECCKDSLGITEKITKVNTQKVLLSRISNCNLEKRNGNHSIRYCKNGCWRSILPKFIYVMNSNLQIKKPTLNSVNSTKQLMELDEISNDSTRR